MPCVNLFLLVILKLESLDLVDYFLSYVVFKFGDELHLCSILELCCVLMKIDGRFMLVEAC